MAPVWKCLLGSCGLPPVKGKTRLPAWLSVRPGHAFEGGVHGHGATGGQCPSATPPIGFAQKKFSLRFFLLFLFLSSTRPLDSAIIMRTTRTGILSVPNRAAVDEYAISRRGDEGFSANGSIRTGRVSLLLLGRCQRNRTFLALANSHMLQYILR